MDLYTTLDRIKDEIADGAPRAMTPLSEEALGVCDPTALEGMGGLVGDSEKGLKCPVKGCEYWGHRLTTHLNKRHAEIGGAEAVKDVLEIPWAASLVSKTHKARLSAQLDVTRRQGKLGAAGSQVGIAALARGRIVSAARRRGKRKGVSAGERNLKNLCEAQIQSRFWSMYDRIRRPPTTYEALLLEGGRFVRAVQRFYGTWENAIEHVGMADIPKPRKKEVRARDLVIEAIGGFHAAHGRLPTEVDARRQNQVPFIPRPYHVQRVMNTDTFSEAVLKVARMLGVEELHVAA